jgi:hypothetical protein
VATVRKARETRRSVRHSDHVETDTPTSSSFSRTPEAAPVLSHQAALGNQATIHLLRRDKNTDCSSQLPDITSEPARVLALQRMIGNQATVRLLQRDTDTDRDAKITHLRDRVQNQKPNWKNAKSQKKVSNRSEKVEQASDTVIEETGLVSGFKDETSVALANFASQNPTLAFDGIYSDWLQENKLPQDTSLDSLSEEQLDDLEQKEIEEGGLSVTSKDADTRSDLGIGAGVAGTLAAGAGSMGAFASMVASITKLSVSKDPLWEKIILGMDAAGQGLQTGALAGQALGSAGMTTASGVASMGNETATEAANMMSGISDSLGSVAPVVQVFLSSLHVVRDLVKFVSKKQPTRREKKALALEIGKNVLEAAKAFLLTARSTISAIRTFLDIAGAAATLTSIVPIIGAAINICVQFIDMVLQIIDIVRHAIRVHKSRLMSNRMAARREQEKQKQGSLEQVEMLDKLREVNRKRMRRAIRPMVAASVSTVASLVSMGGSLMNVIGVATSPAYGAGVAVMAAGYALSAGAGIAKLGAGASKPIAGGIRTVKQKARDFAGVENPQTKQKTRAAVKKVFRVNTKKTSEKKHKRDVQTVKQLFIRLAKLPAYDNNDKDVKAQYKDAYELLRATGVDRQALFRETDIEVQVQKLIEAIKRRE